MIKLYYSNEDKSVGNDGWVIDYGQLDEINGDLASLGLYIDHSTIEAILLVADGQYGILNEQMKDLDIF